ncbi:MAG TPA: FMN-binding negative transcriptional regulator [Candidatus Binataceae bacterium]|nr:FMN-binding negative transcriptional regulator [Candidatus Binataceae bacterium]
MYIPKAFEVTDSSTLYEFIAAYSFGTLVTVVGEQPLATRLPMILDRTCGRHGTLLGHLARANPQWRSFDGERQGLVMFDGPHAYVSPSWYATSPAVPTWNYATVHVRGIPRPIHDPEQLSALVDRLVGYYEAGMPQPWPNRLPADFKAMMLKEIVGFAIEIDTIEGKFKMGQNRPVEDRIGTVLRLEVSPDPAARALAKLTRKHLGLDAASVSSPRTSGK